jgi:formylglycine-generating enzyme required for sulfatase activity
MRGGSWDLSANAVRSAYRAGNLSGTRSQWIGFRLALSFSP